MIIIITIATFFSTFLGGLFALRLKDRLHLVLGFSAGAIIAVAFFDLLPEAFELAGKILEPRALLTFTVFGFVAYMTLDRLILLNKHHHHNDGGSEQSVQRASIGAGSLSFHSFLDGMGIGLAFQVSNTVGAIVAVAVLTHDFSDGINTVSMVLKNGGERKKALHWLLVDALAPVIGVLSTLFFTLSSEALGILLALFSGFFLYIGASDLIPESHHSHPTMWTTIMTVFGIAVLYIAISIVG